MVPMNLLQGSLQGSDRKGPIDLGIGGAAGKERGNNPLGLW